MIPKTMRAVVLDAFGGVDQLNLRTIPIPELAPDEVLIQLHTAGVGQWDPFEREGGYAELLGLDPHFPYILGSEGSGTVVDKGNEVSRFTIGQEVYAAGFLNPKGGFYAEYVAVKSEYVSELPHQLTLEQAGAMSGVGLTALRGLSDVLNVQRGESVLIFGASGAMGHIAIQLANLLGTYVIAVASGEDGVNLCKRLGAHVTIDGRGSDILETLRSQLSTPINTALFTSGGEAAEKAFPLIHTEGRIAVPNGVQLQLDDKRIKMFNGDPDADILKRLNQVINSGKFEVYIDQKFSLEKVADAHRALERHHLGKIAITIK